MYGAGDDGPEAWPAGVRELGGTFLARDPGVAGDDPAADAARLVQLADGRPVHFVAVSYGGIAAVLASQRAPSLVRSLTLFEPACADFARTAASVQRLRREFAPVVAARGEPGVSDADYLAAYAAAAGSRPPEDPGQAQVLARRLRSSPLPWEVPTRSDEPLVPTLVVTGGWSDFYEDVAHAMTRAGAEHRVLPGFDHAVLDHPAAAGLLDGLFVGAM